VLRAHRQYTNATSNDRPYEQTSEAVPMASPLARMCQASDCLRVEKSSMSRFLLLVSSFRLTFPPASLSLNPTTLVSQFLKPLSLRSVLRHWEILPPYSNSHWPVGTIQERSALEQEGNVAYPQIISGRALSIGRPPVSLLSGLSLAAHIIGAKSPFQIRPNDSGVTLSKSACLQGQAIRSGFCFEP